MTLVSAFVLYFMTSVSAIIALYNGLSAGEWDVAATKVLAVKILKIVDLFLISVGLHIISGGMYKLYINDKVKLPSGMNVDSLDELKFSLAKICSLVLLVLFVEMAVDHEDALALMYNGFAIAAVLISIFWGSRIINKKKDKT